MKRRIKKVTKPKSNDVINFKSSARRRFNVLFLFFPSESQRIIPSKPPNAIRIKKGNQTLSFAEKMAKIVHPTNKRTLNNNGSPLSSLTNNVNFLSMITARITETKTTMAETIPATPCNPANNSQTIARENNILTSVSTHRFITRISCVISSKKQYS